MFIITAISILIPMTTRIFITSLLAKSSRRPLSARFYEVTFTRCRADFLFDSRKDFTLQQFLSCSKNHTTCLFYPSLKKKTGKQSACRLCNGRKAFKIKVPAKQENFDKTLVMRKIRHNQDVDFCKNRSSVT